MTESNKDKLFKILEMLNGLTHTINEMQKKTDEFVNTYRKKYENLNEKINSFEEICNQMKEKHK